jgi:peptide/nickel transport system substrate-binding protein
MRVPLQSRSTVPLALGTPLVIVLLALACGRGESSAPAVAAKGTASPSRGGTAVLGMGADLDSLNPYLSRQSLTRDVAYQIFETLMEEQPDFGQGPPTFRPGLASSWEFSADGLEVTFHLRPNAVWSDGVPITAEDVRFSWQASVHPDVAWLAADIKRFIENVEVLDAHAVRFRFTRVYPYQLMDANDGVILPRHIWSRVAFAEWRTAGLDREPVCSGPFQVERWTPNQSIELVRNERYYDPERPLLERVVFRIIPDAASGLEQLLAGQIDYWDKIEPRHVRRLERSPAVALHRYPDRYYGFIAWNCSRPLFSDPAMRTALTLAIDRQRIVDDLFHGTAQAASGPIPPLYWAHNRDLEPHPHGPDEAGRLLDAAGWRDEDGDGWRERDGAPFQFEIQVNADSPIRQDMALMVQEDLKRVGLDARPVALERNTYGSRHRAREFDAFIGGWRLPTKVDLAVTFASRASEHGVNYGLYSNPELDALLTRADQASRASEAKPVLDEAQQILHRDQPYTFLYWRDRLVGFSSRLRDVQPNAQSPLFDLDEWWIPPEMRRP